MNYSRDLMEAIETPSIPEQISFLDTLDEHVTTAVYTGFFTEDVMESAFVSILSESGFAEYPSEEELHEAIDEWLDEEWDLLERQDRSVQIAKAKAAAKKGAKSAGKSVLKSVGKEIIRQGADPLAKRITKIKTKSKTGKMLKHAAAGAVKQIKRDPRKAKEILKRGAKKVGKKLVKGAVKKGMKMVFGKWLKTEHEEAITMLEAAYMPPSPQATKPEGDRYQEVGSMVRYVRLRYPDLNDIYYDTWKGKSVWVGLRNNVDKQDHAARLDKLYGVLKKIGWTSRKKKDGGLTRALVARPK